VTTATPSRPRVTPVGLFHPPPPESARIRLSLPYPPSAKGGSRG